MDVSWLHQVEDGAKRGIGDSLSGLFSDDLMSQSSDTSSVIGSPRMSPRRTPEGLMISTHSPNLFGDPELPSPRSPTSPTSPHSPHSPFLNPGRPHHSHFAKNSDSSSVADGNETERKVKMPFAAGDADGFPKLVPAAPAFASPGGDSIAHFIYESYFGRKSLAQHDRKHAALLGCSQVADYLTLLNGGSNVVFSPNMFNNLLTAVVKKFSNEVIPRFIDSPIFQVMVCCLIQTNYFTKPSEKGNREQRDLDRKVIAKTSNALIDSVWQACHIVKKPKVEDDAASSSDESDAEHETINKEEKKVGESPKA